MVFTSGIFLQAFLPAFLLLYLLAPKSWRSLVLALSSYVFYGWWRPDFVLLMLFSSVLDYTLGRRIASAKEQNPDPDAKAGKKWLVLSMVANLSLLGYFKYANFGIDTFLELMRAMGFESDFTWVKVVLPVGISFYTFQTMSYTIDVYRGHAPPVSRFVDFLCYVAMFPQLVAGPIVRYSVVAEELRSRTHTLAKFYQGVLLLQIGLSKKVLFADVLAPLADSAFAAGPELSTGAAWLGIVAYSFQIYFDFSGYSDMAIGLGLMLGFHFPINFDSPYRSLSITEFWRRWHISLSSWLRDYLYIPLGGSKKGVLRTYVNLSLTMLLGGLWHGASWHFVAWGGYQGFWLVIERLAGKRPWYGPLPKVLRLLLTFVLVLFGWVLFRAARLSDALDYMYVMLGLSPGLSAGQAGPQFPVAATLLQWLALGLGALVIWFGPTSRRLALRASPLFVLLLQLWFVLALLHLHYQDEVPFLYFQF